MKQILLDEVLKLKDKAYVDKKTFAAFIKRIAKNTLYVKEQNLADHLCTFLVPYDRKSRSVYLGHHIKADDWIPPGGHMEPSETPPQTVYREFKEELDHELVNEPVELFNLSIIDLTSNPRHSCFLHYDFWYIVHMPQLDFNFDRGEFYEAHWHTLPEAKKKMKLKLFNDIIQKLNLL